MLSHVFRGISYSAFLAAATVSLTYAGPMFGAIVSASPSSVLLPVPLALVLAVPYIWGSLFMLASFACLLGVITRTWVGEYIGLGALILCVIILGISQAAAGLWISGLVTACGLSCMLAYRLYLVNVERRKALTKIDSLQDWYRQRAGQE